jgi:RNA polymerase sigma-70 factor (ECF subfamily)
MRRDPLAHPERLIQAVYAYVAYRVGPGMDAEDITSEVFERALRYRESYDPEQGEPMAWLFGIARRCVNGAYSNPQPAPEVVEDLPAPDDVAETAVRRLSLIDAVSQLGDRDRELIALRYGADLSGRQIGAVLDMSANAVDVAMHRALERLRQALEGPAESVFRPRR